MAWIIQSVKEGPLTIDDLGIVMTHMQLRDMDLIGRENAERSKCLRIAIASKWVKEIRKDPHVPGLDPRVMQDMVKAQQDQARAQQDQTKEMAALSKKNDELHAKVEEATAKVEEATKATRSVLEEVKAFTERSPLDAKVIVEALRNIQIEQNKIMTDKQELISSGLSEAETKVQEKILSLKDKKLKKNSENITKTVSKSSEDMKDVLDAMDELGIE